MKLPSLLISTLTVLLVSASACDDSHELDTTMGAANPTGGTAAGGTAAGGITGAGVSAGGTTSGTGTTPAGGSIGSTPGTGTPGTGTMTGGMGGTSVGNPGGGGGQTGGGVRDAGVIAPVDGGGSTKPDAGVSDAGGSTGGNPVSDGGGFIRGPEPTAQSATKPGPYMVKSYTSGFRDSPAYAASEIFYPVNADPPFASVAIVPGFVSTRDSVENWGRVFASYGIVSHVIDTNSGLDQPPDRAAALLEALATLKSEHERSGSPINGKLDLSRQGLMGWSMGGGGTLISSEKTPSLKAAIAICPWNPGSTYPKMKVPVLFFAGTADVLAGGQSQPFYASVPETTPKLLFESNGADHFWANDPASQGGVVGRYGLSWMKVFLEGDERYRQFLTVKPPNASDYRTNVK